MFYPLNYGERAQYSEGILIDVEVCACDCLQTATGIKIASRRIRARLGHDRSSASEDSRGIAGCCNALFHRSWEQLFLTMRIDGRQAAR